MNYWIFNAAPFSSGEESFTARQIYEQRMQDRFWGLGERTQNRRKVKNGDQVVFYIARPESSFAGTARLASDSFELGPVEQDRFSHNTQFFRATYGVRLEMIETWNQPRPVVALAPQLDFIEDARQWWTYLQGGVRQIGETDYAKIIAGIVTQPAPTNEQLAAQSLFALEAHLEEFIAHNWSRISWGANLKLFQDGEETGRQFPAGTWSIDFLAIDQTNNDLVVIELKRGKTSDATIGQILRYISWVRENIASPGQNVRGIIIASEVDDALRYAARDLPNVTVKTYSVSFSLKSV